MAYVVYVLVVVNEEGVKELLLDLGWMHTYGVVAVCCATGLLAMLSVMCWLSQKGIRCKRAGGGL